MPHPVIQYLASDGVRQAFNKQTQMMKFDGERWQLFGPIIEDTGISG